MIRFGRAPRPQPTLYVRIFEHTTYKPYVNEDGKLIVVLPPNKEIQFWFFFAFNGCQTHRTRTFNPGITVGHVHTTFSDVRRSAA